MPESIPEIVPSCRVTMHFSLSLLDGTEAVSTYNEAPLEFILGDGTMEPLLEYALLGLRAGDEQSLQISGDEVYGPLDESKIHWLPITAFPANLSICEAQIIAFTSEQGEELPGVIMQIEKERVLVDFNHPLSGKAFIYNVTIINVEQPG
jgi:FKBP-type peptidyl-prolyl cis-trans isomerase SlpA